jgi:two-component system nitrogen regulation response regulator NtrX
MPKPRILVIDDEAAIRDSLRMTLEYEGYEFIGAATGQEGLALAERDAPDIVLLDVKMPGMDGIEVLERLRNMNESVPIVVVSGHGTISTAVEATKKGAFDFIEKPFASERVLVSLRNALDSRQLRDEVRTLKKAVEVRHQMIGESAGLKQIMAAVGKAAPTNATVLITGESGVGKELVARTIHRNSLRSRERFVQVNCAAIPEELIESELFGHEKGSFTGATEKQIGKFEQADRGTIFLDEVGDMSAKTQAKVLRVLQEGEVERLGSARTVKVDVRVIAATNKNLEEEIEKGQFREDLYFRLAVIPIHVPPLRERPDDIAPLVRHYVDFFNRENNARPRRITQAALDALARYRWRGNIRELRNTVERLIIMTAGDVIDVSDLPESVRSPSASSGTNWAGAGAARSDGALASPKSASAEGSGETKAGTLREFKENAERMFLVGKLRENGWNISKTAEVIGTPRSNLYKKLEQYQISQETDG